MSEYVDRAEQEAYADGFVDGQIDVIDEVFDMLDQGSSFEDVLGYLEETKKEIESL